MDAYKDVHEERDLNSVFNLNLQAYDPRNTIEDTVQCYSRWTTYDRDLALAGFKGPLIAADTVDQWTGNKEALILDVGAGTGAVAKELIKRGFCNFDALDPCKEMLRIAQTKKFYRNVITEAVTSEKTTIPEDTYDVVVSSGAFGQGHVPCAGLKELIRITKPGGCVITVMRKEYLECKEYKDRLEPFIQRLENLGYWQCVQQKVVEKFVYESYEGIVYVCKVKLAGFPNFDQIFE